MLMHNLEQWFHLGDSHPKLMVTRGVMGNVYQSVLLLRRREKDVSDAFDQLELRRARRNCSLLASALRSRLSKEEIDLGVFLALLATFWLISPMLMSPILMSRLPPAFLPPPMLFSFLLVMAFRFVSDASVASRSTLSSRSYCFRFSFFEFFLDISTLPENPFTLAFNPPTQCDRRACELSGFTVQSHSQDLLRNFTCPYFESTL